MATLAFVKACLLRAITNYLAAVAKVTVKYEKLVFPTFGDYEVSIEEVGLNTKGRWHRCFFHVCVVPLKRVTNTSVKLSGCGCVEELAVVHD